MRIFAVVKTGAKKEYVEQLDPTHFRVAVRALPIEGKANLAIMKALAKALGISRSQLILKSGATSKQKVFVIEDR